MAFSNHDLVFDSPTNNFATWNPVHPSNNAVSGPTFTEGALRHAGNQSDGYSSFEIPTSGKWYCEILLVTSVAPQCGIGRKDAPGGGSSTGFYGTYANPTQYVHYDGSNTTTSNAGFNSTAGSITRLYIDADNNAFWMSKDNYWFTSDGTLTTAPTFGSGGLYNGTNPLNFKDGYHIMVSNGNTADVWHANFGQDPTFGGNKVPTKVYTDANGIGRFFYEPPAGALALCTANLAAATTAPTEYIVDETNQHLLTYNGNVTQSKFTPYATDGYSLYSNNAGLKLTDTASNFNYLHNNTTDYTVSFWMYRMQDAGSSEILIDSTGGTTEAHGIYFLIDGGGTDKLRIYINKNVGGSNAFKFESNYVVPLRQWVHVSFVFDLANPSGQASTKGKLYINGNLYTSGTYQQDGGYSSSDASQILTLGSAYDGSTYFYGYIADFRIVKNKTVYSGNYTPPNSPYSVSETDQDILISASSVSIKDSNTTVTAKTVTPVGSGEVSISDWSPYTPEAVRTGYEYRNPDEHGGGSFYLSGSGQQILFPTNTDFDFGSGEFSVEMWVYLKSAITGNTPLFGYGNDAGSDYTSFHFEATGGKLQFYQSGSITFTETTASVLVGQWNHLVLSRSGNTINVYSNGQKVITNNFTDATRSGHNLRIGSWYNTTNYGSNGNLNGYITDYKIVKGTTVYSEDGNGNITPPTGPITSDANTKLLLQPYKSKIAKDILNYASDETGKALTYVGNASVVNTSPYKDGVTGSFNFYNSSSSNDYLKLSSSNAWTPGANSPFTIEFWYKTSIPIGTNRPIMTTAGWSSNFLNRWQIQTSSDKIAFWRSDGNGDLFVGATVLATNKWYHVAIVQDSSSVWKMYLNGIQDATGTDSGFTTDSYLEIGANSTLSGDYGVRGQMSDIRIVKGQALYTADFTPPAYPLLSNTYTIDGSDPASGTTITGTTVLLAQPGRFIENTAEADNTDNFKAVTYTGKTDSSTYNNGVVTVGFQPDLVWIKARNQSYNHTLFDSVRGFGKKHLFSDLTSQELANEYGHVSGTDASSFSVADGESGDTYTNNSSTNYVAWCWKAGGAPSDDDKAMVDGVESTITGDAKLDAGTITPTRMSVNTKAGFSIVKYPGASASNSKLPHGLTQAPEMVIIKNLDFNTGWVVGNDYLTNWGYALGLNLTNGEYTASVSFDSTAPTNSVITLGNSSGANNSSYNYIAYCWHSVEGYSKFGSYEGSTALPFVYCGFRPSLLILKNADDSTSWVIHDSARDVYNEVENVLVANGSSNETTYATTGVDFLSNGFKLRGDSSWYGNNLSTTQTVIYMAFAEQPFIYSNAR